jgi:NitT/TauT family transport system substrate-binding protein
VACDGGPLGLYSRRMSPPRKPARAFLILLVALLVASLGCRSTEDKGAAGGGLARVKLAINWVPEPEFGGFYAAREGGAFKRAGMDVEIVGGGVGVPVMQMVASGQVDFGIAGGDEVVNARVRGADVIPIFAVYQTSPQAIMVHASRGAKTMDDVFASGTLAIDPGAPFAAYLKKKHGFDRVKIMPYDGGVARFIADKDFAQECFITSEPIAAERQGSDPKVFLIADDGWNPYNTVVITRRALWKERPAEVRAFVRAVREGWRAYLDDPGPANAVMAQQNKTMEPETWTLAARAQKPFIETDETKRGKLGMMTRARWEELGKQLAAIGVVDRAPPVDDYVVAIDD